VTISILTNENSKGKRKEKKKAPPDFAVVLIVTQARTNLLPVSAEL
jgi:hypothetical protein